MEPTDDNLLLRRYAEDHCDEAFTALVTHHVNLVYSVALRHVGNPQWAEEITQAVFIILSKKAAQLRHEKALSSWLFQTTRLTANNFVRSEARRQHREQEAYMQTALKKTGEDTWRQIAPLLDTAVAGLGEKDRRAIVLRFYEGRNLREVGVALGASEDTAKKRVTRALEKLRTFFTRRGVTLTTAILASAVSANSVHAAPVGLAATISATAAKGAAVATSTLTLVKGVLNIMAWTKAKTAAVATAGILLATGAATIILEQPASKHASSNPPVEPKILWTVGKTYTLRLIETQDMEMGVPGQPQPGKRSVNQTMEYNVSVTRGLANGGRELELSFASTQLDLRDGNRLITQFDSRNDSGGNTADLLIPMLRKLSGFRIKYVTDAAGVVERMEGTEELMQEATRTIKQPGYQEMFKRLFAAEVLKEYVGFGQIMPGRTVTTGDRWSRTSNFESPVGPVVAESQYVFKGLETQNDHKCMRIIQTVRYSPKAGASFKMKNSGGTGNIWFDPELGMIRNCDYEESAKTEVPARGQTMTLQKTMKFQLALLDVK